MKPSSRLPPRKTVDRTAARNAALVNQLATPGLGSLMAGRVAAGTGQLILALAGFVMVCGWFVEVLIQFFGQISGESQPRSYAWLGEAGALVFIAAWLWALVTSLSLIREAKTADANPRRVPPVLGPPPAPPRPPG